MMGLIESLPGVFVFLVPIVGAIALFTFLSIASHAEEKRKEREAFYQFEFRKKMLEHSSGSADLQALLREEDDRRLEQEYHGRKLSGLVTAAVGVGILFGLRWIDDQPIWMVGYIPLAIGLAIFLYAVFLSPKPGRSRPGTSELRPPG
jgi:hypothetical protein